MDGFKVFLLFLSHGKENQTFNGGGGGGRGAQVDLVEFVCIGRAFHFRGVVGLEQMCACVGVFCVCWLARLSQLLSPSSRHLS